MEAKQMKASHKFSCSKSVLLLAIIAVFSQFSYGLWFDCWDNARQCHGDADGQCFLGKCVGLGDMNILKLMYPLPVYYYEFRYDPCADFNRDGVIDNRDVAILEYWLNKIVPADCPGKLRINSMDGKILLAGSNYTITWDDRSGHCTEGELFYSINNGINWTEIDPNCRDGCSCNWIVPDANSEQCMVDIFYYSGVHFWSFTDTTGPFTIYQCLLETESDFNNDCYIDFYDFALLADIWLLTDGTNRNDLLEMSQNWCKCGNPYDPICTE
jgi:hypothetical protein